MFPGNRHNFIHLCWLSKHMDKHDGFCTKGNSLANCFWINTPCVGIKVHKYRSGPGIINRVGSCYPAQIGANDFIPLLETERTAGKMKCERTTVCCNRILYTNIITDCLLETPGVLVKRFIESIFYAIHYIIDFLLCNGWACERNFLIHMRISWCCDRLLHNSASYIWKVRQELLLRRPPGNTCLFGQNRFRSKGNARKNSRL